LQTNSFKRTEIDARYYLLLAIIENRSLRFEKAMEFYKQAIKVNPNFLETYLICGQIKLGQGDYKGALEYFEKVASIDPTCYPAYSHIASAKWGMGDKNAYAERVYRTRAIKNLDETWQQLFNANDFGNRRRIVIERFDKIIEQFPDSARAYFIRGFVKYWECDCLNALDDLNIAITLEPSDAYMHLCRGHIKMNLHNNDGAISDYNKAIELDPNLVDAYISRSREKFAVEDYRGFIEDSLQIVKLNPLLADKQEAMLQISQKKMMQAKMKFKKATSTNPKDASAYAKLGYTKLFMGDMEGARKDLNKSRELNPSLENFDATKEFIESSQKEFEHALKIKDKLDEARDTQKERRLKELFALLVGTEFESKIKYADQKALLQLYDLASYSLNGAEHRWKHAYFENGPKPNKQDFVRACFASYFNKGFKCEYCDRPLSFRSKLKNQIDLCSIDHKLPMANGGDSTYSNLAVVCTACNIMKGTMSTDTYVAVVDGLKKAGPDILNKWFEEGLPGKFANKLEKDEHIAKLIRKNRSTK